jgi:hypothetical protein
MVCPDEMFESPRTFFRSCLNIVDFNGRDVDGLGRICACCEISVDAIDQRHPSYHWSRHDGSLKCLCLGCANMSSGLVLVWRG